MQGNINLKPEVKHNLGFTYDFKKSDSLNLFVSAEANYYNNRFGNNLSSRPEEIQSVFIDNVGNSKSALITFLAAKTFSSIGNLTYRLSFNYNELPNVVNNEKKETNGITVTQSLSTNRTIVNNILKIEPIISVSYNEYYYNNIAQTSTNLIYSDKLSLSLAGFEINTYPIVNISKATISQNFNWGINSEIKKKIFNSYGLIWIKAYDIFDTFQIRYNAFGPSYTQTFKYSNFSRYFLLGLSFKFNNMK
jgi:hypothetical protein